MSHFIITGASVPPRSEGTLLPKRLEINDFIKDEKMFSLYVQALSAASSKDQTKLTSFFKLGGIHGLPYTSWDEDPQLEGRGGYCTHGTTLFPCWHRPYIALFEQVLQTHAVAIAKTYMVDTDAWKDAADNLRQPYWDWAKNIVPPPEAIELEKVTITTPDGQRTQVDNPLMKYRFQTKEPSFYPPYSDWSTTLRWPTTTNADATSNLQALRKNLSQEQESIRTNTAIMLTRIHKWSDFSNHTEGPGKVLANSLETIHDAVHNFIGGPNGHMSDPAVAGFDPIFLLHHTNVDRMLSLWSALNPGVGVSPDEEREGTMTLPPGAKLDEHTPLTPFRNTMEGFWTSSNGSSTGSFGYSYPEFEGLNMNDSAAVQARIADLVDELYSPTLHLPTLNFAKQPNNQANTDRHKDDSTIWEWSARIRVKRYQLGSNFAVLIFLGEPPESPDEWHSSDAYCGSFHTFVNSARTRCENCIKQDKLDVEGFVHLQTSIAKQSSLGKFDPDHVTPYLTKHLQWRIQKLDGTVVPCEECPSLEVTVAAVPLTLPPGAAFPNAGNAVYHHHVTRNRRGGARA